MQRRSPTPLSGMTWTDCSAANSRLEPRITADGSFSLWSESFDQAFHSARGAIEEARTTFLAPAGLEGLAPRSDVAVLELCVGTGTNTAQLLDRCRKLDLKLRWWGLESDRRPLQLALADPRFRCQCSEQSLELLDSLAKTGSCLAGPMLWGDARQSLQNLMPKVEAQCDLVIHDAFSPRVCPELWSLEFLTLVARCLKPEGRIVTYCSAAAVRQCLKLVGLHQAGLPPPTGSGPHQWSGGTVASWKVLELKPPLQAFTAMELEHQLTRAAQPYRDPRLNATSEQIRQDRQQQQLLGTGLSTSAWRRRWQGGAGLTDPGRFPPS